MGKNCEILAQVNDRLIDFLVGGFAGAIVENCAGATPQRYFRGLEAAGVALSSQSFLTNFLGFLAIEAIANFAINPDGSVWSYDELPFTIEHGVNPLVTFMFAFLGTGARRILDQLSTRQKVGLSIALAFFVFMTTNRS